jgi:hypothetical protein
MIAGIEQGRLTTQWSRPGQAGIEFGAILSLASRAAHLEGVRQIQEMSK